MDEVRRNWISGLMEYGVGVITCYLVIGYQPMKRYIEACFGGRCRLIKSQCCFLNGNVWFSKKISEALDIGKGHLFTYKLI